MKRTAAVLMISLFLLLLTACGSSGSGDAAQEPAAGSAVSDSDGAETPAETGETAEAPAETEEAPEEVTEPAAQEAATVQVGELSLTLDQEGDYYDLAYRYPGQMRLDESSGERDFIIYDGEGYDPYAFAMDVSRVQGYSVDEIMEGVPRLEAEKTTVEYNGIVWTTGTVEVEHDDGGSGRSTVYVSTIGDYVYVLRFVSQDADQFDLTGFADAFAQCVTLR